VYQQGGLLAPKDTVSYIFPPTCSADSVMGDGFRYIRQAAQRLRDEFDSDVPRTVDELCSLPGVGPKMAFLCLHAAWDMCVVPSHPFFSAALLMGD
jgi:hypothetical protein